MANEKRLIDAHELAKNWFYTNDTGTKVVELLEIEQAPTVDAVEVVHGQWVDEYQGFMYYDAACSVCGERNDSASNYCPNCGAKMDGGTTSDEKR